MKITRKWAMPNKNTFKIKPIFELILKYIGGGSDYHWIDPFANDSVFKEHFVTNDINKKFKTTHNMEALDFLKLFSDNSVDGAVYDPPYSSYQGRKVYEGYKGLQRPSDMYMRELCRIIKPQGYVISCGWNSNGMPKNRGFEKQEALLIAHGSGHNDTIVTVDRKEVML